MSKKNNPDDTRTEILIVDDSPYKTGFTEKYRNRKPWTSRDARKITAFLPGTVTQVLVKKGDDVKIEQIVVKFEAMKMVNNVQTAIAGKVKDIYVKPGDKFSKGFVLLELE